MILMPKDFDIAGGVGVLALNAVIGGIVGGFVLIAKIIKLPFDLVRNLQV